MTNAVVTPVASDLRTLSGSSARSLGAYYTSDGAATYMANWALRNATDHVLEPSMGDGQFLRAIRATAQARELTHVTCSGVELAPDTFQTALATGLISADHAHNKDFLSLKPFPVDAVIGNPPYVRLRHLPLAEAKTAREAAEAVLGKPMDPAGSIWMSFVLHACQFLRRGGRLALVLPYDLTYVRYARPLWNYLGAHFASLRVVRVHQRVFSEILQDVVLFFADGYGGAVESVTFEAFEKREDLFSGAAPLRTSQIPLSRIAEGERPFIEALLPPRLSELLYRLNAGTRPLSELVRFNIGYVSGDKHFFHPSTETVKEFGLPSSSLRPALTASRKMTAQGIRTGQLRDSSTDYLFLPAPEAGELSESERRYVQSGEKRLVHERYKCSIRSPWYVTPGVKVPDLVMPVFASRPTLLINDGQYVVSNSLLAGYLNEGTADQVAAAWYTSLTLLQVELNVHHLGGGVLVFVPTEAGSLRIAAKPVQNTHLSAVDAHLKRSDFEGAYATGDENVLVTCLGLMPRDVELVRDGVAVLRHWRLGRAARPSLEDVEED